MLIRQSGCAGWSAPLLFACNKVRFSLNRACIGVHYSPLIQTLPGRVAQWVTYLTADMCLTADPEVVSTIPARSHTFMEIDHEIISKVILLPSANSRRVVVSYKRKYVHKVLVNRLVKLA